MHHSRNTARVSDARTGNYARRCRADTQKVEHVCKRVKGDADIPVRPDPIQNAHTIALTNADHNQMGKVRREWLGHVQKRIVHGDGEDRRQWLGEKRARHKLTEQCV